MNISQKEYNKFLVNLWDDDSINTSQIMKYYTFHFNLICHEKIDLIYNGYEHLFDIKSKTTNDRETYDKRVKFVYAIGRYLDKHTCLPNYQPDSDDDSSDPDTISIKYDLKTLANLMWDKNQINLCENQKIKK